jgi:hypothetical protein
MPTNRLPRERSRHPTVTPELGVLFKRGLALGAKWRNGGAFGEGMTEAERYEYLAISSRLGAAFQRRPWQYCLLDDFSGPALDPDDPDLGCWESGKAAQKELRAAARMKPQPG